jgi:hypothetical protein
MGRLELILKITFFLRLPMKIKLEDREGVNLEKKEREHDLQKLQLLGKS